MATKNIPTLAEIVATAEGVIAERQAYQSDWRNRFPNRDAWVAACVALAGCSSEAELAVIVDKVKAEGRLLGLCQRIAAGWCLVTGSNGQPATDRPAVHGSFRDDVGEPGAFVERKLAGLTAEQASAVAGIIAAESYSYGRASSLEEASLRMAEFNHQLEALRQAEASGRFTMADVRSVIARGYRIEASGSVIDQVEAGLAVTPTVRPLFRDDYYARHPVLQAEPAAA